MESNQVRKVFLEFFASKGHKVVPSAPLVVKDDPTLMFTNAGMNQFKDYFLGHKQPTVLRVTDAQKCLRVSGKQNDLEEVGHDTYHHTMFEMLGNWSFGDYFKREAISWAWELLVDVFGIDPERLYVTFFEGSPADGIPRDTEAEELWHQYVPTTHVLEGSPKDNFWEMGDTGPCGPCSEIHIDLRPDAERQATPGSSLVNKDHPRVIEIWNLVFIQYNRKADGTLEPLPAKHVDTGMGFERLCMVLQGCESNYDTDVFRPLIAAAAQLSGKQYGVDDATDVALKVVADHVRAVAFSIADGQLPSNNKAGYVIRRILRRAVRYGYSFLGLREPFLCQLVPTLTDQMGDNYPELRRQKVLIERVIHEEESAFLRTLASGIQLLETLADKAAASGQKKLDGESAFTLYDTYGFPIDLTELMLRERGMGLDHDEFARCMEQQKARSRNAAQVTTGDWVEVHTGEGPEFVGYDQLECDCQILRMRRMESKGNRVCQLVLNRSPFYAESGGQVGDRGLLQSANERIEVLGTIKENALPILIVHDFPECPEATFHATVDREARQDTACHHTATHLLHYALRQVLGSHVEQKGSLVEPGYLRFDFSHFQRMTAEELRRVEEIVNTMVRRSTAREEHRDIPIADAMAMGAMALFGEKYGEHVRVLRFGESVELCGGTHVENTGAIGLFRIVSEGAIAAGIRRIVAVAGRQAELRDYTMSDTLAEVDTLLHAQGKTLEAVERMVHENAELRKQLQAMRQGQLAGQARELYTQAATRGAVRIVRAVVPGCGVDDLKEIAQCLRGMGPDVVAVLGSPHEGKAALALAISEELSQTHGWDAGKIVRGASKPIQGGGGGTPGLATAGGKNPDGVEEAMGLILTTLGLEG